MNKLNEPELRQGLYHLKRIRYPTQIQGLFEDERRFNRDNSAQVFLGLLNNSFQQILGRQHSLLNFEELYRYGYYLVLHKYGLLLYSSLENEISQHLLQNVQPKALESVNRNFLHVMNRSWDNHHSSMLIIKDILMYLDRVYTKHVGLINIYSLGLSLFRDLIVCHGPIQSQLQSTLLRLVMVERRGELIDRCSFRSITKMLKVLGNNSDEVYKQNFEEPFLLQSANFFKEESQALLRDRNCSLYLKRVEVLIAREIERSEQCFDESTTPQLRIVAENELIRAHVNTIVNMRDSGVVYMMEHQMTEDLTRMYNLLNRVHDGLNAIFECISQYIRFKGLELNGDENSNNAIAYVQGLLELKEKFDFYLINSFSNDKNFKKVVASEFESILNQNSKSPEHLSLFIDEKLKKTARGMTEEDKILLLEKTVVLFRFLQDKDLFQQHYKQNLAKRLLIGKGLNEESEKEVILKFKDECGSHFTRKMEGMFRDMSSSCTLTEQFLKYVNSIGNPTEGVDLSLRVLTAFYWPTQKSPPHCNLPPAPLAAFETFKNFYLGRHCGRRLTLLPQLGSAELETYFVQSCEDGEGWHSAQTQPCGEMRSYVLQVSTYQMCVLMLFNERPHWSFQELQTETNIQTKDLQRALQSLTTGKLTQKVLLKQPNSCNVEFTDNFYVNTSFTSKSNKVKIPLFQAKNETDSEKKDALKIASAAHNFEIEAAIMRILKAEKVMNHDNLMKEVVESLKKRFTPSKDVVKTRIEVLIERQYIARHPVDRRIYEYVP